MIMKSEILVKNDTITLKDHSKLVVGSFYRPPNQGVSPILELESQLSEIMDTFRNNPKTTLILGGDFNAGDIDWETGLYIYSA